MIGVDPFEPTPPEAGEEPGDDSSESGAPASGSFATSSRWVPPTPEEVNRLLPQYGIESLLGRGGMGAVYKGIQPALDRPVAIKLLAAEFSTDEEFIGRFQREARTLAKLHHSGIVAIYDFGQTSEGHLYFVMEYVDGTDLRNVLNGPGLNPDQAFDLVGQICEALQAAHAQGVTHRDIKPENILLTNDGTVKIADFGLARPLNEEESVTHVVMGTPEYMSPEQRMGHVDHRTDIYAVGVLLYEMLTGKCPHGVFLPPSRKVAVDARIDEVVLKALQEDPEHRYQRASEMKRDVDRIRTGAFESSAPAVTATPRPKRRVALAVGVAAGMLLAGAAFISWEKWGRQQTPADPQMPAGAASGAVSSPSSSANPVEPGSAGTDFSSKAIKITSIGGVRGYKPVTLTQTTDDPNDVLLGKPVCFDTQTENEVYYAVNSTVPLTKLIYTGAAFKEFTIQVLDGSGALKASAGPYTYGHLQKTIEVPLPDISRFELVLTNHTDNWFLIKEIRFLGGQSASAEQGGAVPPGALKCAFVAEKSAKTRPVGTNVTFGGTEPADLNGLLRGEPVYFDLTSRKGIRFSVDSPTPLAKLIYSCEAKNFTIQAVGENGIVLASAGPFSGEKHKKRTVELPLTGLSRFEVAMVEHSEWMMAYSIQFTTGADASAATPDVRPGH